MGEVKNALAEVCADSNFHFVRTPLPQILGEIL